MSTIKKDTKTKKACVECGKDGAGVFTCDGCQGSFCIEHVAKHRQDLDRELDIIGQEQDHLQRDLDQKSLTHPVLDRINQWEEDSIKQIKQAAELARTKVRQLDEHRNDKLKMAFDRIKQELRSAREANDYSEIDLIKWRKATTNYRKELDTPLAIHTINNDNIPPIHLIKVIETEAVTNLDDQEQGPLTERFQTISGPASLSEEGLVATYTGNILSGYASVRSLKQYSSGTHVLRFRLESKSNNPVFLGIVSASEPSIPRTYKSSSAYGWRDISSTVNGGVSIKKSSKTAGQTPCRENRGDFDDFRKNRRKIVINRISQKYR